MSVGSSTGAHSTTATQCPKRSEQQAEHIRTCMHPETAELSRAPRTHTEQRNRGTEEIPAYDENAWLHASSRAYLVAEKQREAVAVILWWWW
jgi:hypothetical protein